MQIFTKIDLDLLRPAVQVIVHAKQNDKAARFVQANLWQGAQPFAHSEVLAVFRAAKPDGTATFYDTNENGDPAIVIDGNIATIELVEQVLTVPGDVAAELNLYTGTGEKLTSFTFTIRVQASVLNDAEIVSSNYYNVLTNTLTQAQAAADRAEAAAERAEDLSGELVKSVNNQTPDAEGAVTIDVGVMTVNNQSPDENGNVNVQAGVSSVFGREGAVTAQTGDYNVSQITGAVRPNLLDNWYFGNPVNQRGQTEYTGGGYTIDRWKTNNANQALALDTDGISYEAAAQGQLSEWLEVPFESIAGKAITISAIINGILYSESATVQGNIPTAYTTLAEITVSSALRVRLGYSTNQSRLELVVAFGGAGSCKLTAAKLELGEGQTLAHQDADGNWVLNEIPDYAEELAKCQRYFVRIKNEGTATGFIGTGVATSTNGTICVLPLPVSMRAAPALSGWSGVTFGDGGSSDTTAATSVEAVAAAAPYNTRPVVIRGAATRGDAYVIFLTAGGYLDFSADL